MTNAIDDVEARRIVQRLVDENQGNLRLLDYVLAFLGDTLRRLHILEQLKNH